MSRFWHHDKDTEDQQAQLIPDAADTGALAQEAATIAANLQKSKGGILKALTPVTAPELKADTPKLDLSGQTNSPADSIQPASGESKRPHNYFTEGDMPKPAARTSDALPVKLMQLSNYNLKKAVEQTKDVQKTCIELIGAVYGKAGLSEADQALSLTKTSPHAPLDKDKVADLVNVLDQGISITTGWRHSYYPARAGLKDLKDLVTKTAPAPWLNTENDLGPFWQQAQKDVKALEGPLGQMKNLAQAKVIDATTAKTIALQASKILNSCENLYEDWDKLQDERNDETDFEHNQKVQAEKEAARNAQADREVKELQNEIAPYTAAARAFVTIDEAAQRIQENLNENFPRKGFFEKFTDGMAAVQTFGASTIMEHAAEDPDCKKQLAQDLDAINAACHTIRENFQIPALLASERNTNLMQKLQYMGIADGQGAFRDFRRDVMASFIVPRDDGKNYLDDVQAWSGNHTLRPDALYKKIDTLRQALWQIAEPCRAIKNIDTSLSYKMSRYNGLPLLPPLNLGRWP